MEKSLVTKKLKRRGYWEKFKAGTAHKQYDPKEGRGSAREWRHLFNVTMNFEEAQAFRDQQKGWRSEYLIIGGLAGINIHHKSTWLEVKSAFRKATMNCHPDRCVQHGKSYAQAEAEFKELSAAYVILADQYGVGEKKKNV